MSELYFGIAKALVVMIQIGSAQVVEIFTAFGQLGISAEKVADTAAREAREYLSSHAAVGEHLADQLLLPMALAGGGSYTALKFNSHARTNAEVIGNFLPIKFQVTNHGRFTSVDTGNAAQ